LFELHAELISPSVLQGLAPPPPARTPRVHPPHLPRRRA
jgi:hypothetical protein